MIKFVLIYATLLQVALTQDPPPPAPELNRTWLPQPNPPFPIKKEEIPPSYWETLARKEIDRANQLFPEFRSGIKKAKNVILFLGDGMGLPTVSATRFDESVGSGTAHMQIYEDWDFGTLCRTYDLETMVTDSASSATAYLTGTKTRTAMIGVTGEVFYKQCSLYSNEEKIESTLTAAHNTGKWTGIVTTSRITHASPAGCYGHVAFRDWEGDSYLPTDCKPECQCTDLAYQLVTEHPYIHVIMGGGQENFYPSGEALPSDTAAKGKRVDGKNLAQEWEKIQKDNGRKYVYTDSPSAFQQTQFSDYDYAFSLMSASHLPYELDKTPGNPGLYEMALAAVSILSKSPEGFFLFIEGARIDQAHHENRAMKSFKEMHEFNRTIHAVAELMNIDETLLIVTADHSHSFTLIGRQNRQDNFFADDKYYGPQALDKKGMTPIGYMTGPGASANSSRKNISTLDLMNKETQLQALVPIGWATHGGDDVGVYSKGPFSYLFHTTVENTFVAQAMKYAMCAAPYNHEPFCVACALKTSLLTLVGLIVWAISN